MGMGGIERMICDFSQALDPARFEVRVAVFEGGGSLQSQLEDNGVKVYCLDKNEGIDFGLIIRLRRLLREMRIDIVHSNNFSAWLYSVASVVGYSHAVCVHTEHSSVDAHIGRRYLLERFLSYRTACVVAVSEQVRQNLVNRGGIEPGRVRYIPNGIDTDRFVADSRARLAVRNELGLAEKGLLVGAIGRLVSVKDHRTLVSAFALMHKREPRMRLVLVGDGDQAGALRRQVERLGLSRAVMFLGERHDIERLLNAIDIYVMSSLSEGMSLGLIEAMSSATPIVATRVGGNVLLIKDGKTGILVPAADPAEMASAVCRLANDPVLRARLARQAREFAVKSFSRRAMIDNYMDIYTDVTRSKK